MPYDPSGALPVGQNPFAGSSASQLAQIIQQANAQLASQPQRMPTSYGNPDGDAAAMSPETFANPAVKGMIDSLVTLPRRAIENSQNSLDTGNYDPGPTLEAATLPMGTGAVAGVPVKAGEAVLGAGPIRAYHGSPHDFDAFSLDKIGTGEGAQAYGHGLYFAENEGIAKGYRDKLADTPSTARFYLNRAAGDPSKAAQDYWTDIIRGPNMTAAEMEQAKQTAAVIQRGGAGRMYKVDINADPAKMLDWDAPIPSATWEKMPGNVRDAIDESLDNRMMVPIGDDPSIYTGKHLYQALRHENVHEALPAEVGNSSWYTGNTTEKRHTSEFLNSLEIPGIKYLDQGSRAAGDGSRNYVVFNDKLIDIMRKYGMVGAIPAAGGAGFGALAQQGQQQNGL